MQCFNMAWREKAFLLPQINIIYLVSLFTNIPLDLVNESIKKRWNSIQNHCDIQGVLSTYTEGISQTIRDTKLVK